MTTQPLTLRSPAELLAVIPHLLGFEPRNAIVVVALKGNKISLTQRMDLPGPERVEETADTLVRHLLRDDADAALLVGYEDTLGGTRALMDALRDRLEARAVSVRDRILVHAGRWRSLDCDRPACCPPDGTPLPPPDEVASAVAEFIGLGSAPLPDRRALAEQLEPGPRAAEVATLLERGRNGRTTSTTSAAQRRLAGVWVRVLTTDSEPVSPSDAAVALHSLEDISTRDGITSLLIPDSLGMDVLPAGTQSLLRRISAVRAIRGPDEEVSIYGAVKARLIELTQHAPDEHAAPVLTVLASYTWWHGDGAIARVAIDRALQCDPTYRLALLMCVMLDEGIRPTCP